MQFDSIEQELRVRLAHRVGAKFSQYKRLCEWLDCYQYILPKSRRLDIRFIDDQIKTCYSSSDLFHLYLTVVTIETTLSVIDQGRLCQLIHA